MSPVMNVTAGSWRVRRLVGQDEHGSGRAVFFAVREATMAPITAIAVVPIARWPRGRCRPGSTAQVPSSGSPRPQAGRQPRRRDPRYDRSPLMTRPSMCRRRG
jgi:hypothetical protein